MDHHAQAVAAGIGGHATATVRQDEQRDVLVPAPEPRAIGPGILPRIHGHLSRVRTGVVGDAGVPGGEPAPTADPALAPRRTP
jgi:hypothetical protein